MSHSTREHAAAAGRVAVAVDVVADLAAEARVALVEEADPEGAGCGRGVGDAAEGERRGR